MDYLQVNDSETHGKRIPDEVKAEIKSALVTHAAPVAERLLGPPNRDTRNKPEWRWTKGAGMRVIVSGPRAGACADFRSDWTGDLIDLIEREQHLDFLGALRWAGDFLGISVDAPFVPESAEKKRAREEAEAKRRAEGEQKEKKRREYQLRFARELWKRSEPIDGTVAERYLAQTRGISAPPNGWPDVIRYQPARRALIVGATNEQGEITFVQMVHITPDGQKITDEERKKRGIIAVKETRGPLADTGAFVRLPGNPAGPLLLAEGPETGLSVWASTGYETRLSIGSLTRHTPPHGRSVVICRDDDAPGSQADKTLVRELDAWSDNGASIRVATPWPERRNDKSDFNDVLRSEGPLAVVCRIESAEVWNRNPQDFTPPVRYSRDEARRILQEKTADFAQAGLAYMRTRHTAENSKLAELTERATFPEKYVAKIDAIRAYRRERDTVNAMPRQERGRFGDRLRSLRNSVKLTTEAARECASEVRRIKAEIRKSARTEGRRIAGAPPVHAIKVDVGVGKTHAAQHQSVEYLEEYNRSVIHLLQKTRGKDRKATVAYFDPTHKLARQLVEKFNAMDEAISAGYQAALYASRLAPDPYHPDFDRDDLKENKKTKMCLMPQAVQAAMDAQVDVSAACCIGKRPDGTEAKCPRFHQCGFQRQAALRPDVVIMPHESLFYDKPAMVGHVAAVIVDERSWQKGQFGGKMPIDRKGNENKDDDGIDKSPKLTLDALLGDPGDVEGADELRASRLALYAALKEINPAPKEIIPVSRSALIAQGITEQSALAASALEWQRKIQPAMWPSMAEHDRKEAAQKARRNFEVRRLSGIWRTVAEVVSGQQERSRLLSVIAPATSDGAVRKISTMGYRDIHPSWDAPVLLVDATMNLDLIKPYWPSAELKADIRVEMPNQRIYQVTDRSFSKDWLRDDKNLRKIHAIIVREALARSGRVLVIIQKEFRIKLKQMYLPPNVDLANHNGIAGRDDWGPQYQGKKMIDPGVELLILVGRTMPAHLDAARMAEIFSGGVIDYDCKYKKVRVQRETREGIVWADTWCHPDPLAEGIRQQICEGEMMQGIGRLRGANRTEDNIAEAMIYSDINLPLPVDRILKWEDVAPSPMDLMVAENGIGLTNAKHASIAFPDLWNDERSVENARNASEQMGQKSGGGTEFPIGSIHREFSTTSAKMSHLPYQVAGMGAKAAGLMFDPARVNRNDIETWLVSKLGPLAWFGERAAHAERQSAVAKMAERGVVVVGSHAAKFYPDIFDKGVDAAKKAISRSPEFQDVRASYQELSCVVQYRPDIPKIGAALAYATPERFLTLRHDLEDVWEVPMALFNVLHHPDMEPSATELDRIYRSLFEAMELKIRENMAELVVDILDGEIVVDALGAIDIDIAEKLSPGIDAFLGAWDRYKAVAL